ncbi:Heat shock protein 70 family, partial [Cynara cardunculus var. scolymus]
HTAILSKEFDENEANIILLDVTALSLDIEGAGGTMTVLIPTYSMFPCVQEGLYSTFSDNQRSVSIQIPSTKHHESKHINQRSMWEQQRHVKDERGLAAVRTENISGKNDRSEHQMCDEALEFAVCIRVPLGINEIFAQMDKEWNLMVLFYVIDELKEEQHGYYFVVGGITPTPLGEEALVVGALVAPAVKA